MNNIIVSPSGKLYGSEQVLLDYLKYSRGQFLVFVCGKDLLYDELKQNFRQHRIVAFKNVKLLYLRILYLCLIGHVNSVYLNEAGHSKFIVALSKLFSRTRFVIHVRLIEDTRRDRWPYRFKHNVHVLSVSNFLQRIIPVHNSAVYDPYLFRLDLNNHRSTAKQKLQVAVIGRVSLTKGIDRIIRLLQLIEERNCQKFFHFRFYGEVMPDVIESGRYEALKGFQNITMCGFEPLKEKIYNDVDCVLHGSDIETLGRVFLEAVDHCKPFIGIKEGGIGEIGRLLRLESLLVDSDESRISSEFLQKLLFTREKYEVVLADVIEKKKYAREIFDPVNYAHKIDSLLL